MQADELARMAEAELEEQAKFDHIVYVCMGSTCASAGAGDVLAALQSEVKAQGQEHRCRITGGGCQGLCAAGPMVSMSEDVRYEKVEPTDAKEIIENLDKAPIERLYIAPETPFFARQKRVVLESAGRQDPESLEEYIARGGYEAAVKALTDMSPVEVIDEITRSGLRGRGGAGYSVGLKWNTVAKATNRQKYIICNGDEGDPGAFMDRSVMEDNPHRVIEGMIIAAFAVGASQGYVYVRAEYPLAVKRLKAAIRQAQKLNLLGSNICGTPVNFDIDVRLGAGAFVCGEETALIASIEGRRGQPRTRPPYPSESGLWGYPTLVNNVETYSNVAPIIRNGADWFTKIGTEKSRGTKVFALSGQIANTGLIEVPMGMTLREIVFDIGGGVPAGREFKAVQTGGPSGGCIPAQYLDMPVDYESLLSIGSFMGSGGMIVMDDSSNMVEVAEYFMEFCKEESCGKCIPCRVGTAHLHELLGRFVKHEATLDDLALLEELCTMVRETSLCGLGQAAPNPITSTLRYFRDEYLACLKDNGHELEAAGSALSEEAK